jgi:hypothetical protein
MDMHFNLSALPEELKSRAQWVAWRYVDQVGKLKPIKMPIDPKTGANASSTNPNHWADIEIAAAYAEQCECGIGFVLTGDDEFCCIDIDHTTDPAALCVQEGIWAAAQGAYTETSPSGKGCHIWLTCTEKVTHSRPSELPHIECYTENRFMTMSGRDARGVILPMPDALAVKLEPCFRKKPEDKRLHVIPLLSDIDVLHKTRNDFGSRFELLWQGLWSGHYESQSNADFHLACMLARYTSDLHQLKELFFMSALGKREKAQRASYIEPTLVKAMAVAAEELAAIEHGRQQAERIGFGGRALSKKTPRAALVWWKDFIPRQSLLKLVNGVLGEGGFSALYGAPGSGKSFLAMDIAFAIATGTSWMGREVVQGSVLYAAGEGASGLRLRRTALTRVKGIESPPVAFLPLALDITIESGAIIDFISQMKVETGSIPRLLIIDTLNRYFGDGDENSSKDMKRFIDSVGKIHEIYPELHIMIVHHAGKEEEKGLRGSSALKGAVDTVIRCRRPGKEGLPFQVAIEKQKDGDDQMVFAFTLLSVDIGADSDGEVMRSCVVVQEAEKFVSSGILTGHMAYAVGVIKEVAKHDASENKDIQLRDIYAEWCRGRPDDKKDSVRKTARRMLAQLKERRAIEWGEGECPVRVLPALYDLQIGSDRSGEMISPPPTWVKPALSDFSAR